MNSTQKKEVDPANWVTFKEPFITRHKWKLIGGIALIAIGSMVAGGIMLYLGVNAMTVKALLIGGGIVAFFDAGGAVAAIKNRQKKDTVVNEKPTDFSTYKIVSWDIDTTDGFLLQEQIRNDMKDKCREYKQEVSEDNQKRFLDAVYAENVKKELKATPNDKARKIEILKETFQRFDSSDSPDIICLQNTKEMTDKDLRKFLPKDYDFFTYQDEYKRKGNTVVWKTTRFTKLAKAEMGYREFSSAKSPDTIIKLQDNVSKITICVASAHLTEAEYPDARKYACESAKQQLIYDLKTMEKSDAYFKFFAGDLTRWYFDPEIQRTLGLSTYGYTRVDKNYSTTFSIIKIKDENYISYQASDQIWAKTRSNDEGFKFETNFESKATPELWDYSQPHASGHRHVDAKVTMTHEYVKGRNS